MKLLVSDYDGTLKTFENSPNIIEKINFKMNLKAINEFILKGNKFVISTGRPTESIKKEIQAYNINYSYLTTYDGAVTFNNTNNVIDANYLNIAYLKELKELLKNYKDLISIKKYNIEGVTSQTDNLILISIKARSFDILKKLLKDTNEIDASRIYSASPITKKIVIKESINKSNSIEKLILNENLQIKKEDIITIGDGNNDIEMIRDYNGYAMYISYPHVFFNTEKKISSVHSLIKKINKS